MAQTNCIETNIRWRVQKETNKAKCNETFPLLAPPNQCCQEAAFCIFLPTIGTLIHLRIPRRAMPHACIDDQIIWTTKAAELAKGRWSILFSRLHWPTKVHRNNQSCRQSNIVNTRFGSLIGAVARMIPARMKETRPIAGPRIVFDQVSTVNTKTD